MFFQGTNFKIKLYMITEHIVIFYFFIGYSDSFFKILPLIGFFMFYIAAIYKVYMEE